MKQPTLSPTMHLPSIVDMTPAEKQAWIARQAHRDRDLHNDVARRARAYQALCAELIEAFEDVMNEIVGENYNDDEGFTVEARRVIASARTKMKELGK